MENFAEVFNENSKKMMKMFQESVSTFQANQSDFMKKYYNMDIFQKNFENMTNFSKEAINNTLAFGKQNSFNMFPKESVDSMKAAFTKQAEYFTDLNQKYIDSISKQIAASKSLIDSSVTEKIKKEVEKNIKLSQEALQSIVDNYNKVVNPSIESNKKNFNQLNEQIESSLKANLKLWSKFLNNNNTKETEKKDESAFAEKSHNGFDKNANSTVYPKNKNLRFTSNNKK